MVCKKETKKIMNKIKMISMAMGVLFLTMCAPPEGSDTEMYSVVGSEQGGGAPDGAVSASEMAPTEGSLPVRDGRDRLLGLHDEESDEDAR